MTIEWLLENFLVNYDERCSNYLAERIYSGDEFAFEDELNFFNCNNFSEALENFAKAQRKECGNTLQQTHKSNGQPLTSLDILSIIYHAPIPHSLNDC